MDKQSQGEAYTHTSRSRSMSLLIMFSARFLTSCANQTIQQQQTTGAREAREWTRHRCRLIGADLDRCRPGFQ